MTGGDFDSNVAQLARENQLMEAAGLHTARGEGRAEDVSREENEKEDEEEADEPEDDDNK